MHFQTVTLDDLRIDDERSFRHVGLYDALKQRLRDDAYRFRVAVPRGGSRNGRGPNTLLLNLVFWDSAGQGDVLETDHIPADVVMHAAWHHVTTQALDRAGVPVCADGLILSESIASAFDVYLVGRLLGHAPDSEFLAAAVPAMADAAEAAGLSEDGFEALLASVAADPDAAFVELRELLFDATTRLAACADVEAAQTVLDDLGGHRFASLLHYFEIANWVLATRTRGAPGPDPQVRALDAALRATPSVIDWLERTWIDAGNRSGGPPGRP